MGFGLGIGSSSSSSSGGTITAPLDAGGALLVGSESSFPTYRACTALYTPAATATDTCIFSLKNYGKSASIKRITVSGLSTSGATTSRVRLQQTPAGSLPSSGNIVTPTTVFSDQTDYTPTAQVQALLANRTAGDDGISVTRPLLDEQDMVWGNATTGGGVPAIFDYTGGNRKCPMIKNLTFYFVINLNGQTIPSGGAIRITWEWEERRQLRIACIGDSTTALATLGNPGYLNGGDNYGGIGNSGYTNTKYIVDNFGSNGYRLLDYINNLNGVTYPQQNTQTRTPLDVVVFCYGINDIRQGVIGQTEADATNRLISMIDTSLYGLLNQALASSNSTLMQSTVSGATYQSPKANIIQISNITWAANVATVTTIGNHGFASSETCAINITGNSQSAYNIAVAIASVPTSNTLTFALSSSTATGTGGSLAFATIWPGSFTCQPDCKVILWGPNSFTTDDVGLGSPYYYVSNSNSSYVFNELFTGLNLAQAAQLCSRVLYNAYAAFVGDPRVFAVVQKQDIFGKTSAPLFNGVLMENQIHPGPRGQTVELRQILPIINAAASAAASYVF